MDFFKHKRSTYLLLTLQKAYEQAYQASVRAIVLETRNEHVEALHAWKSTLRTISLNMAAITDTPKTSQEVDLMTNIMNIEKQCHDRIAFLERGWTDTNPYSSYMLNSDDFIASQTSPRPPPPKIASSSTTSSASSVGTDYSSRYTNTSSSRSVQSSADPSKSFSNQSLIDLSSSPNPKHSSSPLNNSSSFKNPFSSTAPPCDPLLLSTSSTSPNASSSSPYYNSNISSNVDYFSDIYPRNSFDTERSGINSTTNNNNNSNTQVPPPIPPKISLDFADPPNPPPHNSQYQARLDPQSSAYTSFSNPSPQSEILPQTLVSSSAVASAASTSTSTVIFSTSRHNSSTTTLTHPVARASPKRRPTPNSDAISKDMNALFFKKKHDDIPKKEQEPPRRSLDVSPRPSTNSHKSHSRTQSDVAALSTSSATGNYKHSNTHPQQASSTPVLLHLSSPTAISPPKASSTSSLASDSSHKSPASVFTSTDQQFAALKLATGRTSTDSRSSSESQTNQAAPRSMLKTLRSSQKVPKRVFDERKAAADAAHLAWPAHTTRTISPNQQAFMAANLSSNQGRATPPTTSSSSSSSSTRHVYTKPKGFKSPVIHAPISKTAAAKKTTPPATTSSSRSGSTPPIAKPASATPVRKTNKYIVEKKKNIPSKQPVSRTQSAPKPVKSNTPANGATAASKRIASATNRSSTPDSSDRQDTNSDLSDPMDGIDVGDMTEEELWLQGARETVKKIKGIDQNAADSIFNDVVVKGDPVVWEDIAGLEKAKGSLKEAVVYPFLRPDLFSGLREPAQGMLLFGPPGTGKTMLARAVATESKSTFFSISASSLTSKFLGESEKLVRALFLMAKALAPSIIFVDEIDSLLSARSDSGEHESSRRIKTEFLIQWSALQHAAAGKEHDDVTRVLVLGATNLPWVIDEAARRRFVRRQYIPLPEPETRDHHLKKLLSRQKHSLTLKEIAELVRLTDGFSGSDLTALAKDAAMGPLRALGEALLTTPTDQIRPLGFQDFLASLQTIRPSVSQDSLKVFEDWADMYGSSGA